MLNGILWAFYHVCVCWKGIFSWFIWSDKATFKLNGTCTTVCTGPQKIQALEERAVSLPRGVNVVHSVFQRIDKASFLGSNSHKCCLLINAIGLDCTFHKHFVLFGGRYATTLRQWWQIFSPPFIFLLDGQGIVSTQITPQSINFGLL